MENRDLLILRISLFLCPDHAPRAPERPPPRCGTSDGEGWRGGEPRALAWCCQGRSPSSRAVERDRPWMTGSVHRGTRPPRETTDHATRTPPRLARSPPTSRTQPRPTTSRRQPRLTPPSPRRLPGP